MTTITYGAQPLKTLSGMFHELELYPDRLVIKHNDFFSQLLGHDEVIGLDEIVAVYVNTANFLVRNWFQVEIMCYNHKSISLSYRPSQEKDVRQLKEMIEDLMHCREELPVLHDAKA
jgi:hypothetical protein